MKTKHVRPVLVESKDIHSQLEIDDIYIGKLSYEAKQYHCKHPQELILISLEDEKIEEGEYLNLAHRVIVQPTDLEWANSNSNNLKKVIARQSQISPEYISKFIELYNKGCIEDLEIEMEKCWINSDNVKGNSFTEVAKFEPSINDFDAVLIIQPKLTNGFITIVEKEPITYTEEEVKSLCSGAYSLGLSSLKSEIPDLEEMMELDNWFENNKKK